MGLVAKTFRLQESTARALKAAAPSKTSVPNQTEIVESSVRERLGLAPSSSRAGGRAAPRARTARVAPVQATTAEAPPEPLIELDRWLSGKTGMPRAACAMAISRGDVKLGGQEVAGVKHPLRLLARGVEAFGETYLP